ncbi:shikimate dehydrogenase [Clostridium ganghwense]|uniref:Shikimate dehydrogenase (NADP(+)) n=1 Tax=Clostridium ganghwense TaxID=312089 RepID=A0ABT4CPS9_9CLOT|nr:shikimate dehydrogenase [Clostridium ganghwense]MCY6369989.1 shikimate dehydrogenase [Clostridium ganghwense]
MKSLYGLLGEKLTHSFSPQIHSEIFKKISIDGHYQLFEVEKKNLVDAVAGLKALKVRGVNVTIPYKVEVMKFLDSISEEAEKIGAVNTICLKNGKSIGYNTDYYGFGMMLNRFNVNLNNKVAVILGTGGAARAVLQYLIDNGVDEVILVSRNKEEGKTKFKDFKVISYEELNSVNRLDIVINSTPCGMYPNIENSPLSKDIISKFNIAIDLIYNPKETLFLKYAKETGLKVINGLYMLVDQAVKAEELWNSIKVDSKIVDKIHSIVDSKL